MGEHELTEEKNRERRQLLSVASMYLDLAKLWGADKCVEQGATTHQDCTGPACAWTFETQARLYASAHLTSAAIRLYTVEEAWSGEDIRKKYTAWLCGDAQGKLERWLHFMLKDDVTHAETHTQGNGQQQLRNDRLMRIRAMTSAQIADALRETHRRLELEIPGLDKD